MHNGIIENYAQLRDQLQKEGYQFVSETDTEVIVHLVSKYYEGDLPAAFRRAVKDLQGAFAVGIISADHPDQMVAARRFSPLVVGIGEGENWIASDMGAVRQWTDQVYIIDDDEMAVITRDGIELTDFEGNPVERAPYTIPGPPKPRRRAAISTSCTWRSTSSRGPCARSARSSHRCGEVHHPRHAQYDRTGDQDLHRVSSPPRHRLPRRAGRALPDGEAGAHPSECDLAAELRTRSGGARRCPRDHCQPVGRDRRHCALRSFSEKGAKVISVVNVVDSSIARESDGVVYIQAGPEISGSTSAYTLQILTIALIRRTSPTYAGPPASTSSSPCGAQ